MKGFHGSTRLTRTILAVTLVAAAVVAPTPQAASAQHDSSDGLTPIVLFPAWHFTRLAVTVHNQHVDPNCPGSGTFEDLVNFDPGPTFSQVCRDELLTLRYDARLAQTDAATVLRAARREGVDRRLRPDFQCPVVRADV